MATPKKPREEHLQAGRPTEYKSEYCEKVVEHMREGNSFWSFAAIADVSMETLSNWCEKYPEFLEAKKRGLGHLLAYDEKVAKAGIKGQLKRLARVTTIEQEDGSVKVIRDFDAATFAQTYQIFLMKNRYPDLYRDKREVENTNNNYESNLTPEQRKARIAELEKKRKANAK